VKKSIIETHRNWKTTVVGWVILGFEGYRALNGCPMQETNILIGIGLILSKDSDKKENKL